MQGCDFAQGYLLSQLINSADQLSRYEQAAGTKADTALSYQARHLSAQIS
jgi:hypothetical protein